MADFFAKRKQTAVPKINLIEKETTASASPKKYSKHTTTNGFNSKNINDRVKKCMSRQPKDQWRDYQNSCLIPFTYVIQNWKFGDKSCQVYHFSPWGIPEAIANRMGKPQVKANFSALPTEVCEKLSITQKTFIKELVEINITNTAHQNPQHFVRFYCKDCQKNLLPKLLSNSKYGTFKTIEELINNWDAEIPDDLMDIVGCSICSLDEQVHMGPNKNNFFKDPTEHRKSELWFEDATKVSKKHQERAELIQKLIVVNTEAAAPKTLTLSKPAVVTKEISNTSSSSTTEQAILTSKYNKKTKFCFVDQTFQKKLAVQSKCESSLRKVAKGFCLSVVHSGMNKCLSESAIIEMYNTAYRGIYDHHLVKEETYKFTK